MKKLIEGIVSFRKNKRAEVAKTFATLALGQKPDALFFSCSDSRVAVNVFASTDPGDLFVVRNVGNLIPPCGDEGKSESDESEAAAIEFALSNLSVKDIIICGHSECGAMQALHNGRQKVPMPNLSSWLRHGEPSKDIAKKYPLVGEGLAEHNKMSQLNVLLQMQHLLSYPLVEKKVRLKEIRLHGWWFELKNAEVFSFNKNQGRFVSFDESEAKRMLSEEA